VRLRDDQGDRSGEQQRPHHPVHQAISRRL
jgi:hypothetical protein